MHPKFVKKHGLLLAGARVEAALGKALSGELNQKHSKVVLGDVHSVKQQSGLQEGEQSSQFSFFSRFLKKRGRNRKSGGMVWEYIVRINSGRENGEMASP